MIELPISAAAGGLGYAIIGYMRQQKTFEPQKMLVTVFTSIIWGIVISGLGLESGNAVIDGSAAVTLSSVSKKLYQWARNELTSYGVW